MTDVSLMAVIVPSNWVAANTAACAALAGFAGFAAMDRGAVAQLAVEGLVEGAETWSGEAQGGRQALLLDPGLELRMGPHLSGQLDLRWPIVEHLAAHAHDDEGSLRVGPQVSLSLAWTGRP